jgi:hypothetical protein
MPGGRAFRPLDVRQMSADGLAPPIRARAGLTSAIADRRSAKVDAMVDQVVAI